MDTIKESQEYIQRTVPCIDKDLFKKDWNNLKI